MAISDSFKKHGITAISYSPRSVIDSVAAVMGILRQRGERRAVALCVAGLIVRMQAELAGDSIDNTIELMKLYLASLEKTPGKA